MKNIENIYPLSPMQQGMLFHTLYAPESDVYQVQTVLTLEGQLNVAAFKNAWQQIVERHPVLRTAFVWENLDEPLQVVRKQVSLRWNEIDWRERSVSWQKEELEKYLRADREQGFVPSKAPLIRFALIRVEDDRYEFICSHHHLLLDGWSVSRIFSEAFTAYAALADHRQPQFKPIRPYSDYIGWLQRQDMPSAQRFWQQTLRGFTAPTSLRVRAESAPNQQQGTYCTQQLRLSENLTARLHAFARQHRFTMNTLVQGAWALLLSRYSGERNVVFGATVSGRSAELPGSESMVGCLINTLPVRVNIPRTISVASWLQQLQQHQVEQRQYEYSSLASIQQWSEVPPGEPLFENVLVFENYPVDNSFENQVQKLRIVAERSVERTNYPLMLMAIPGKEFLLKISYDRLSLEDDTVIRMLGHLETLLKRLAETPNGRLMEVSMLTLAERQRLILEWNDTEKEFPRDRCVQELFQEQARKTPNNVAIVCGEEKLTYQQLNERANQLANYLRRLGVRPETLVGICVERSPQMVIGLLAILKAGGAYVPLDPAFPPERLAFMQEDANLSVLLTEERIAKELSSPPSEILCLDTDWYSLRGESSEDPPALATPENRAYVIYTSGSTGKPKGVEICHRALTNFLSAVGDEPGMSGDDLLLAVTTLSFDIAALEIYLPLVTGGQLAILSSEQAADPTELETKVAETGATVMQATPAMWRMLIDAGWQESQQLKILCGGEALDRDLANSLIARCSSLWNMYGPTETTIWSTMSQISSENGPISIGRPMANTQVYLVDNDCNLVPHGVPGELYIGGEGLARGYLGRPELTAERFIPNPFGSRAGARLYRTGDLARYLPDGRIECLGRLDLQVKLRGYRIELGEIENVLRQNPAVSEVVTVIREDEPGNRRLVAYVVAATGKEVRTNELRRYLQQQLPEYMLPSIIVELKELPLTPNAKIDRKALPVPDLSRSEEDQSFAEPRTPVESTLVLVWKEILKRPKVGIHDNFFELGGHSLMATQVISRVRQRLQVELPLRALFGSPTVAGLAQQIETARQETAGRAEPEIAPVARDRPLPMSFAQQRLWFLNEYEVNNSAYSIPWAMVVRGRLDIAALVRSLEELVARHETLRTTFDVVDGEPVQVIEQKPALDFATIDIGDLSEERRRETITEIAHAEAQRPFDLSSSSPMRVRLIRSSDEEHALLITIHHIASDGWSFGLIVTEIGALYEAFSNGKSPALPKLPVQYADYAVWQRERLQGETLDEQLSYWRRQLEGAPAVLELPADRPRPAIQTFRGAQKSAEFSSTLKTALKELSQSAGVTLFMTLLAAFVVLLGRYTAEEDIVVGTPIAGRNREELERLVGFFVNTLVLRTDLSGNPSFKELLARVRGVTIEAYAHQEVPFEKLVDELQPERSLSYTPLFQVVFTLENAPREDFQLSGLTLQKMELPKETSKFDLTLFVSEEAETLSCTVEYNTSLFEAGTIERLLGHYGRLLEGIVSNADERIWELPMLLDDERRQLVQEWNETATEYPQAKCIHELFEEQVERTPEAVAVVYEKQALSYAELNRRANRLAHQLRQLGVGPEVLVAVCMERSIEMVVGLMGILKAGGAYVPVDPEYPRDRLSSILADTGAPVLLTQKDLRGVVPEQGMNVIEVDVAPETVGENFANLVNQALLDNVAYVIYTSGSTGKPKGAMNTHRGLCNRLLWMQETYGLTEADRVLQKTPTSFDVSVWEFFWPLLTGARLVMAAPGGHRDTGYLVNVINRERITTLHFVPSMLKLFLEQQGVSSCASLRQVISSGEALSIDLQERFFDRLSARLHNLYGPTEASIDVTFWECRNGQEPSVPIGRPIGNTQIYILDPQLRPVPVGVPGELFIGGVGLGRGYLSQPGLTAERFIPSPFAQPLGARLYRTGDLARFGADGAIEYLGRTDFQIKLRGFRIELGEIEAALAEHEGLRESVVLLREDQSGVKQLVAYVVPDRERAFTVWRLLLLQQENLLGDRSARELPNGMSVIYLNKGETEFIYKEIFEEQSYLKHGITLAEGGCVFDVGANIGLFSLFAGHKCKGARVYAFEPIPPVFETLRLNASLYDFDVRVFDFGLSSASSTADFVYYPYASVMSGRYADLAEERETVKSYLLNEQGDNGVARLSAEELETLLNERLAHEDFTCQLRTVSEVMREHAVSKIDLLKIDVEKAELAVLEGIEPGDWPKIKQLVVEVHDIDDRLRRITELLKGHGYSLAVEQDSLLKNTNLYNIYAVQRAGSLDNGLPAQSPVITAPEARRVWFGASDLIADVQEALKKRLPDYMAPSAFVLVPSLPLTSNGKIDRKALPAPGSIRREESAYVAPKTPLEIGIAVIWSRVLGIKDVGIHDSFFKLGGHSLLAMEAVSKIQQELHIELPLRWVFEEPTVARLAARLEGLPPQDASPEIPAIRRVTRDQKLPLSFAQQQLWIVDQFDPHSFAYNQPRGFRLLGKLDSIALRQSFSRMVARHEILRTTFVTDNGTPVQVIAPPSSFDLPIIDLSALAESERETRMNEIVNEVWQRPFDLSAGPLLRAVLLRLTSEEHVLLTTTHHIINDGWSMGVFLREFSAFYNALTVNSEPCLPELPIQYADFAKWQRQTLSGTALEKPLVYWRRKLQGAPEVIPLPTDRPRPPLRSFRGAELPVALSKETTEGLRELASREQATLFMTLLAAFQTLLWWYTSAHDIVVGSPGAGRSRKETEGLIGHFVNSLVLRTDLSGDPQFREVQRRVREVTIEALAHQDAPFERLVEELRPDRNLSYNPLFQVWFVLGDAENETISLQQVRVSPVEIETQAARHELQLDLRDSAVGLKGWLTYSTDLFDRETVAGMAHQFEALLATVVAQPDIRLSALRERLDQAEREYRSEVAHSLEQASREKLKTGRRKSITTTQIVENV